MISLQCLQIKQYIVPLIICAAVPVSIIKSPRYTGVTLCFCPGSYAAAAAAAAAAGRIFLFTR